MPDPTLDATATAGADGLDPDKGTPPFAAPTGYESCGATVCTSDTEAVARAVLEAAGVPGLLADLAVERAAVAVGQRNRDDLQAEIERLREEIRTRDEREAARLAARDAHAEPGSDGYLTSPEITAFWAAYTADGRTAVLGAEGTPEDAAVRGMRAMRLETVAAIRGQACEERQRVRELHPPWVTGHRQFRIVTCFHCIEQTTGDGVSWPCDTAEIVYTAEEIAAVLGAEETPDA